MSLTVIKENSFRLFDFGRTCAVIVLGEPIVRNLGDNIWTYRTYELRMGLINKLYFNFSCTTISKKRVNKVKPAAKILNFK